MLTERQQRPIISGVLPEVDDDHLILEPVARGTTNAYGLAALTLIERRPEAVMLTLPADHVVRGGQKVKNAVAAAVRAAAESESLVAIGLKPTFPSTGLGYIQAPRRGPLGTHRVKRFVEKPDLATARRFLKAGGYYWNVAIAARASCRRRPPVSPPQLASRNFGRELAGARRRLPRQVDVGAAKVSVDGCLPVQRASQVQLLDDA